MKAGLNKLVAKYRHSRHQNRGLPAIVGPRTLTNHPRRWRVRVRLYLPAAPGAKTQPVVDLAMQPDEPIAYSAAAVIARNLIVELIGENPTWEDFEWEVWA